MGVLLGLDWLEIDGFHWFRWVVCPIHLLGPSSNRLPPTFRRSGCWSGLSRTGSRHGSQIAAWTACAQFASSCVRRQCPELLPGLALPRLTGPDLGRFWGPIPRSQKRSWESPDQSQDWFWESTFRVFGRVSRHKNSPITSFQLHPTPVPSAGGQDRRQRVSGFPGRLWPFF